MFDSLLFDPAHWPAGSLGGACIASLLWGLGSALLSPCHLGIIPLLTSHAAGIGPFENKGLQTPTKAFADVLLFALGYYITIPIFGAMIALFGSSLAAGSHYWTIPAGCVLLWFGISMLRGHTCSSTSHLLDFMGKKLGLGPQSGVMALGFGYGLLSGGCSAGFLVPVMMFSLTQGFIVCVLLAACFGIGHCTPMVVVGSSAPLAAKILSHHHEDEHEEHDFNCCHDEPHKAEKIFRTLLAVIMIGVSILFILHPFLEEHH